MKSLLHKVIRESSTRFIVAAIYYSVSSFIFLCRRMLFWPRIWIWLSYLFSEILDFLSNWIKVTLCIDQAFQPNHHMVCQAFHLSQKMHGSGNSRSPQQGLRYEKVHASICQTHSQIREWNCQSSQVVECEELLLQVRYKGTRILDKRRCSYF